MAICSGATMPRRGRRSRTGGWVIANTGAALAQRRAATTWPRYVIETEEWQQIEVSQFALSDSYLANGISAARTGDLGAAEAAAAELESIGDAAATIGHHEVLALVQAARGHADQATALMDEAAEMDETRAARRGAATPLKPAHELYGEILLDLDRPADAAAQFELLALAYAEPLALAPWPRPCRHGDGRSRDRPPRAVRKLVGQWRGEDDAEIIVEARRYLAGS